MRANGRLPYDDHERAIKLLYSLDCKVWEVKVIAIIESPIYETLTVDELYSKIRFTKIDNETKAKYKNPSNPQSIAFVSGGGQSSDSSNLINTSHFGFALSSLVSITEEQVDALGDEELALIKKKFNRFYENKRNRRRGNSKGYFECGDPKYFSADCPKKKKKVEADKPMYKKKKYFDREALKKDFRKKFKVKGRAFLTSLSDFDADSSDDDSSSSSEDEDKKKKKIIDNLNGLCFMAGNNSDTELDLEVQLSADELFMKIDELEDALVAQDRNLKYASMVDELEKAKLVLEELKSRSILLGACKNCPILKFELSENYAKLKDFENKLANASSPKAIILACDTCASLLNELHTCQAEMFRLEDENKLHRSMLSWVSTSEPQLGGQRFGQHVDHGFELFAPHDQKSQMVLHPYPREYITFGDDNSEKVISVGVIKVNDSSVLKEVVLVDNMKYNLLSVSQLLEDGFEVSFKRNASLVIDSFGDLVCGEQELSESIFVNEDFPALVDGDDAGFHPSPAAQELPSASIT
ncbi:uncharacterized protein LOC133892174 [Phragmites australis]|uniref:uncharacterized protein LOC133892174 n=1 Tax=Phragmites australis TaxID=29695 RepID=UPI002D7A3A83|nr:uncharacterized protein LOC133892174 [Phragmites australis]